MNIETTYYSLAEEQASCDQLFARTNRSQPNITAVNKYGGWNMSPSNIFFSNGECWSSMIFPRWRLRSLTALPLRRSMENVKHQQPGVQLSSKERQRDRSRLQHFAAIPIVFWNDIPKASAWRRCIHRGHRHAIREGCLCSRLGLVQFRLRPVVGVLQSGFQCCHRWWRRRSEIVKL